MRLDPQVKEFRFLLALSVTSAIPFLDDTDTGKFVKDILLNREKSLERRFYSRMYLLEVKPYRNKWYKHAIDPGF
ncbi:hypothetical protein V1508DRAFT_423194 [Lipomyces doorenjongii]|uniref:uncharacterized protein n=1 Tax=Lipomyces doorenjongii TaxID=383834 RepID=UPI0034CDD03E